MKRNIALAAVAFAAGLVLGRWTSTEPVSANAALPTVIEARSFVLKDADGHKRGELTVDRDGRPALRLYNEDGRTIWSAPGPTVIPVH